MLRVKKVTYLRGYILQIHFSNGRVKTVDFKSVLSDGGVYLEPLRDVNFFKKVSLDDVGYTICWPNGADFSPDSLYEMGKEVRSRRSNNIRKNLSNKRPISKK